MNALTATFDFASEVEVFERAIRDDGRTVAFLMGAGCGASLSNEAGEPLVPVIAGLTQYVRDNVTKGEPLSTLDNILKEDGVVAPTVESWLSRLRAMLPISGPGGMRGISFEDLRDLESEIASMISTRLDVRLPNDGGGFDAIARWAARGDRTKPVDIFTLNYDMLMEQALERQAQPFFDGFVGSDKPFLDLRAMDDDVMPARWSRLWKMHGSIDWDTDDGRVIRVARAEDRSGNMIHPSHLKYDQSRRMPFFAMQDKLRSFMRTPSSTLVCVGYSFGDEHINDLIFDGLRANSSAVAFGMMHGPIAQYVGLPGWAAGLRNLRVLAPDGAVLAGEERKWSPGTTTAVGIEVSGIGDFGAIGKLLDRQSSL